MLLLNYDQEMIYLNKLLLQQYKLSGNDDHLLDWYILTCISIMIILTQVGNHINVLTGEWKATDFSIGNYVDSYLEYLVKGGVLLRRPELIDMFYG